ncbi:MAG: tetratricopeptide repeat protein [Deltaproteobacteria bacterium]|nr:tetratricopeptide repeat protein [Deltaproteobacteria bacterium]
MLFESAFRYHQSGNLIPAEAAYQRILKNHPRHFDALHMLGVLICQKGELRQGIELLKQAVSLNPLDPTCHNNLGKALHDLGKPKEAIDCFQKAIAIHPKFTLAYCNLGNSLNAVGKAREAIEHCLKAIRLDPHCAEAHNNLGDAFYNLGKPEQAYRSYQKAITLKPDFAKAYYNLAITCDALGNKQEALLCYEKSIELKPDFASAYNDLGIIHKDMGNHEAAILCYRKAIELKPDFAAAYNNIGNLLNDSGSMEQAIESYEKAVEMKADFTEALSNLASLFEQTNQVDKAKKIIAKALRCDPQNPLANYVAARCERRQGRFARALELLQNVNLSPAISKACPGILYEKGILYDRLGEFDKAFQCFSAANKNVAQSLLANQIDKQHYILKIEKLRSNLLAERDSYVDTRPHHSDDVSPVFLMGFPRSGTTLLDQILSACVDVETLEEKPLVQTMIMEFQNQGFRYPEDLPRIDETLAKELKAAYERKLSEYLPYPGYKTIIDKLPLNTIDLGLIYRVFPESKIIFAMRHPADVCLSCFFQNFQLNEAMIHFLELNDTAKFYHLVMSLWNEYTNKLPLNVHVIRYEDLIRNFDAETKKLFDYLSISWNPSIRNFHAHAKARKKIATPSYHQVIEPIYNRSMYRWKKYLKHLEPIFEVLKPHARKFGYTFVEKVPAQVNRQSKWIQPIAYSPFSNSAAN